MNYCVISEDKDYLNALENYYKTHYQQSINLVFSYEPGYVVIAPSPVDDGIFIKLGNKNDHLLGEIDQYQAYDIFFDFLMAYKPICKENYKQRVYGFANGVHRAGCTTLALNMATLLSENQNVFYLSLEQVPTHIRYLNQDRLRSLSDVLYYLKLNQLELKVDHEGLDYWNAYDLLSDYYTLCKNDLVELLDHLKKAGYYHIVIDYSSRLDLLNTLDHQKKFVVINHDLEDYKLVERLDQYLVDPIDLIINKRMEDQIIPETLLSTVSYQAIDYDYNLEGAHQWRSIEIQNQLRAFLNQR